MDEGTDVELEDQLALPPHQIGPSLLALPESQWFGRKSNLVSARTLGETLVAFANAEGGAVVIGLSNGLVQGVGGQVRRQNEWRQAGLNFCDPAVKVAWRQVKCIAAQGQADLLLVGLVQPSPVVHTTKADDVFLRVGDENRRLTFSQRQELVYDKGQSQFDGAAAPGATMDGLDGAILQRYTTAIHSSSPEHALAARGLMTHGNEITVAAALLFGKQPQAAFPSAHVRVVRYSGLTRETGRRQHIADDVRCEGPIPRILAKARAAVERLQPKRRLLGSEGTFVLEGLIPQDAWLEGIVNAVVHRSYSLDGDHIHVDVFDDRIEIESPGTFPGLIKPSDLPNITRFARNPRIARVCADLRFGQELGEGIRRMYEEMRMRGLTAPLYVETRSSVRLTLSSIVTDGRVSGQFKPEFLQIVDLLRRAHSLSTGEVMEALMIARPTALSRLRGLRAAGYVEWVGKSPSDPRAVWRMRSE